MLIVIEKCEKVRKRENVIAAHCRGMASSLPNKAKVCIITNKY
jgi:hypothetical protein